MLFSRPMPLTALVHLCRMFKHGLAAGLSLVDVFRQQSRRGPYSVRPVIERITRRLEQGESLEEALHDERDWFPPIFPALVAVGEQSGNLPEIFGELEEYFELQQQLRRQFRSQTLWPKICFVVAVLVIAGLIWVMSLISPSANPTPFGFGLSGGAGAITLLLFVAGMIAAGYGLFLIVKRRLRFMASIERIVLGLPLIGPCLTAILLSRFCLALKLTLGAGMGVKSALRTSLEAAGSAYYTSRVTAALPGLRKGKDVTEILAATNLFPEEMLNIVATGEESGRLPEVMGQQARFYQEEAGRWMTLLTQGSAWLIYATYAGLAIWAIFRIYSTAIGPVYRELG